MDDKAEYDLAIIGGGVAGLATSILMAGKGYKVILFEKEKYPYQKVCGEYISFESWPFLQQLGIALDEMQLPKIDSLFLTAPNGKSFSTRLPLGGFGISRYKLDGLLAGLAVKAGVHLLQETKVGEVKFNEHFSISFQGKQNREGSVYAKLCCGAFGKRSNLDIKWKRSFTEKNKKLDNFLAVKYHIKTDWQNNTIGLHNFENGYCGISKIEDDRYCLCYMTAASNLKKSNNSIREMEKNVLYKNPHLEKIFTTASG